ncbi:hypothetical protein [Stenotrophomonas terrae]|nr:hypothetical protein [Stenotrophomonas terrae]
MDRHIGSHLIITATLALVLLAASLSASAAEKQRLTQAQYAAFLQQRSSVVGAINAGHWTQATVQARDLLQTSLHIPNAYEHMGALNLLLVTLRHEGLHIESMQAIDQVLAQVAASGGRPVSDQMEILIREGLISASLAGDNAAVQRYQRLMLKEANLPSAQWQWNFDQSRIADGVAHTVLPLVAGAWVLQGVQAASQRSKRTYYHYLYIAPDGETATLDMHISYAPEFQGLDDEEVRRRTATFLRPLFEEAVEGAETLPDLPFPGLIQSKQVTRTPLKTEPDLQHFNWMGVRGDWTVDMRSTSSVEVAAQVLAQLPTLWAPMQWSANPVLGTAGPSTPTN